jgi:prefoldin subunit 5
MRFGGYATPYQNPDPNLEKQTLKSQAEALQSELDFIKKRLSEIETGTATE